MMVRNFTLFFGLCMLLCTQYSQAASSLLRGSAEETIEDSLALAFEQRRAALETRETFLKQEVGGFVRGQRRSLASSMIGKSGSPSASVPSPAPPVKRQRYETCEQNGPLRCDSGLVCKLQATSQNPMDWKSFCTRPSPDEPFVPEPTPIEYSKNDPRANVPLKTYRFLMAHNAATGYFRDSSAVTRGMVQTQRGTLYDLLACGARAMDLRMYVDESGGLFFQHTVPILTPFAQAMADVRTWQSENNRASDDANLVLLFTRRCDDKSTDDIPCEERIQEAFERASIPYVRSSDMKDMTYWEALQLARSTGGVALGVVDGDDAMMDNYSEVFENDSCRGSNPICYASSKALNLLLTHLDNAIEFGRQNYKSFFQVQLLWQSGPDFSERILSGMSIVEDVHYSGLNYDVFEYLKSRSDDKPEVNLLAMDNVCDWGRSINALLREWNHHAGAFST